MREKVVWSSRPLGSANGCCGKTTVMKLSPGKNISISMARLILASLRLRAYGLARVRNALYFRESADVAQLVEQCIRNA